MTERCDTCEYHDGLISKTNFIYGAGWAIVGILVIVLSIIASTLHSAFGEIGKNRDEIQMARKKIKGVQALVSETNINLKHLMEAQGLEYKEASRIE